MNLWTFLTVVIIAWALVEIITSKNKGKGKGNKQLEENYQAMEERVEKMERRIRNLEAIVTDEGFEESKPKESNMTQDSVAQPSQKTSEFNTRLKNKLK